ncbi:MAG: hypothetical protein ACOCRX_11840 [Candidatus Woesearchaeota archaeon]
MGSKYLNAKIDEDLHKKLRMQLLKDDLTYRDWLIKQIKDYVGE